MQKKKSWRRKYHNISVYWKWKHVWCLVCRKFINYLGDLFCNFDICFIKLNNSNTNWLGDLYLWPWPFHDMSGWLWHVLNPGDLCWWPWPLYHTASKHWDIWMGHLHTLAQKADTEKLTLIFPSIGRQNKGSIYLTLPITMTFNIT